MPTKETRPFSEETVFTKLDGGKFRVEKDTHAVSDIEPITQFQQLVQAMNSIKQFISQAKQMKEQSLKHAEWYNTRVKIMNDAKKDLNLDYKELEPIDMKLFEDFIDLDVSKLPKIDIHKDETVEKQPE